MDPTEFGDFSQCIVTILSWNSDRVDRKESSNLVKQQLKPMNSDSAVPDTGLLQRRISNPALKRRAYFMMSLRDNVLVNLRDKLLVHLPKTRVAAPLSSRPPARGRGLRAGTVSETACEPRHPGVGSRTQWDFESGLPRLFFRINTDGPVSSQVFFKNSGTGVGILTREPRARSS